MGKQQGALVVAYLVRGFRLQTPGYRKGHACSR